MWMPSVTRPLPKPWTDRASSISVVLESSIEKACTAAKSNVSGGLDILDVVEAESSGKPVPLGNWSNTNRFQWNWYADSTAPACISKSRGANCVARAAWTTALYSGAFLSGLNKIL